MRLLADSRARVNPLALGEEASCGIERLYALSPPLSSATFHPVVKVLDNRAIEPSQEMVFCLSLISWHLDFEELKLLLHNLVFVLKETDVVAIGQVETVAQIDYRANDCRRLDSSTSSLLFCPLKSALVILLPEIIPTSKSVIVVDTRVQRPAVANDLPKSREVAPVKTNYKTGKSRIHLASLTYRVWQAFHQSQ